MRVDVSVPLCFTSYWSQNLPSHTIQLHILYCLFYKTKIMHSIIPWWN